MTEDTAPSTLNLTGFLLLRIAEDEAVAKGAQRTADHGWFPAAIAAATGGLLDAREDDHIARHGPARVLAECEANTAIVRLHAARHAGQTWGDDECSVCVDDMSHPNPYEWMREPYPCHTLRALAIPYADHEDFQPEWKL